MENEAPLGPEASGEENGEEVPLLMWLWGLGERRELCQRGPGQSPSRKRFYSNFNSSDRFCWQQVTANSSPFVLKSAGTVPLSPKSGGTGTPRKLRLCLCHLCVCVCCAAPLSRLNLSSLAERTERWGTWTKGGGVLRDVVPVIYSACMGQHGPSLCFFLDGDKSHQPLACLVHVLGHHQHAIGHSSVIND